MSPTQPRRDRRCHQRGMKAGTVEPLKKRAGIRRLRERELIMRDESGRPAPDALPRLAACCPPSIPAR